MGFDFIRLHLSYHLILASLSLDMEYLFLMSSNVILSMVVQLLIAILVFLQEEKWMTEGEMVGWHHRLSGHEFGWTP